MTTKPKDIQKRRRILDWMTGEHSTREIRIPLGLPQSTVFQTLVFMENEGLLTRRKQGLQTYWKATGKEIDEQEIIAAGSPYRRQETCLLASVWR